jgi:hypothetical protein
MDSKRLPRRLALALAATVFALAGLEGFARYAEKKAPPPIMPRLPSIRAKDEPAVRSLDGRSIYDDGVAPERRILCLGDSFAYSFNVPYDQAFTYFLQERLNHGRYEGPYGVYNLGRLAAGLVTAGKIYGSVGKRLPHRTVILVYGWNLIGRTYTERRWGWALDLLYDGSHSVIGRSALGRQILDRLYLLIEDRVPRSETKSAAWARAEEDFGRTFHELARDAAENRANVLVVMLDPDPRSRAVVEKISAAEGVPYYQQDFSLDYQDRHWRLVDSHFNGPANRRLAEEVRRRLPNLP